MIYTYFITDDFCHVKIGRTFNVAKRLREVQTGSPMELRVLHVLEGDREKEIHKLFKYYHIRGEWFHLTDEIHEWLGLVPPKINTSPITAEELEIAGEVSIQIMQKYPTLKAGGFNANGNTFMQHPDSLIEFASAIRYIGQVQWTYPFQKPTEYFSYYLKHKAELWCQKAGLSKYISNGKIIAAAFHCGCRVKQDSNTENAYIYLPSDGVDMLAGQIRYV